MAPAPRIAPAPPEPPSFGELDAIVPPNTRSTLNESWKRWAPGLEATLRETYDVLPVSWQRSFSRLGVRDPAGGRRALLATLAVLVALLGVARVARGRATWWSASPTRRPARQLR
jgi:hypothetical protein